MMYHHFASRNESEEGVVMSTGSVNKKEEMAECKTFTVEWRIESALLKSTKYYFHWYDFFLADLQNTAWRLGIQLQVDHLCVCICRVSEGDEEPEIVDIECELDLILVPQKPNLPRCLIGDPPLKIEQTSFDRGERRIIVKGVCCSEVVDVVPRSVIDALKDEDVLLLRCCIRPRNSSFLQSVRHLVQLSPESCPEYFTWTVKDFSSLYRTSYELPKKDKESRNVSFVLEVGDVGDVVGDEVVGDVVRDDDDTIYLWLNVDKQFYWISSVSVVDVKGEKTICLQNCFPFDHSDGFDIPLSIRKSKLLEKKEKFLPNDQLTLFFDLRRGFLKGVLEKIIIGDCIVDDEIAAHNTSNIIRKGSTNNQILTTSSSPTNSSIPRTQGSPMCSDLYRLFKEGQLTDLELVIGSVSIRVHKAVLAARSPVLLDHLTSELRESSQQRVVIEDLQLDTVQHLLEFMYLDCVPDHDWNLALKLYTAACNYRIVGLRLKCSEILKAKLSTQNVCPILSVADTFGDEDLKQFVIEFISLNEDRILLSHEWENFLNEDMPLASRVMLFLHKKRFESQ